MALKKSNIDNQERMKKYRLTYYYKNKESEKNRITKRKEELLEWITEYKTHIECKKCGESDPCCLDFHHRNPLEKDISIANSISYGWSKARILKEIDKCDVLCSNCHRKLHYEMRVDTKFQKL